MPVRSRPAKLSASAETRHRRLPATTRELFDALPPLDGLRTEIMEGKLIVSPVGTPEHARAAMRLYRALVPVMDRYGWEGFAGNVDVCIDGTRDPVEPDFVLAPTDCKRWGTRELLSSGLVMVAEIVSPGSVEADRDKKPGIYAAGAVPILLIVDPVGTPGHVTVLSEPVDGAYQAAARVAMGAVLHIPAPVDVDLDTSIFEW